jgi:DNA repair exonuclease SbcCD ATPase subunit
MSPHPPSPINPSQAVERIREIIVGRHLEKLEQRVAHLESTASHHAQSAAWEDRLCHGEARLEALQDGLKRLAETTREEAEQRNLQQRGEIQRLAAQIQQVAAVKAADSVQPAVDRLEQKIGTWLTNWQGSLHNHLNEREQRLSSQIRQEVASLWENTESQITRLQSRMADRERIEERFNRIAAAARALADCAAPLPSHSGHEHATS